MVAISKLLSGDDKLKQPMSISLLDSDSEEEATKHTANQKKKNNVAMNEDIEMENIMKGLKDSKDSKYEKIALSSIVNSSSSTNGLPQKGSKNISEKKRASIASQSHRKPISIADIINSSETSGHEKSTNNNFKTPKTTYKPSSGTTGRAITLSDIILNINLDNTGTTNGTSTNISVHPSLGGTAASETKKKPVTRKRKSKEDKEDGEKTKKQRKKVISKNGANGNITSNCELKVDDPLIAVDSITSVASAIKRPLTDIKKKSSINAIIDKTLPEIKVDSSSAKAGNSKAIKKSNSANTLKKPSSLKRSSSGITSKNTSSAIKKETSEPPKNSFTTFEKPQHVDSKSTGTVKLVSLNTNKKDGNGVNENLVKRDNMLKISSILNFDSNKNQEIIEIVDVDNEEDEVEDEDEEEDEEDAAFFEEQEKLRQQQEIPLILDIELKANKKKTKQTGPDESEKEQNGDNGSQVIINVMKLAEEKYGFKSIHPSSNYVLDDLFDDNDDVLGGTSIANPNNGVLGNSNDSQNTNAANSGGSATGADSNELLKEFKRNQLKLQKEKEKQLQKHLELQQEQYSNIKESEEKIKKMIASNNRKIGKYDRNDPFIDDAELYWEETRAITQDGFLIYWGALVPENGAKTTHGTTGKYYNKAGKLVKKYRSKPGPKSKKEKEMLARQLEEQRK